MTNTQGLAAPAAYLLRPAIVDAKLMTDKQAQDAVYVATLAEELHVIDRRIAAIEGSSQLKPDEATTGTQDQPVDVEQTAAWIRAKCRELDSRLRRIEQLERSSGRKQSPKAAPFRSGRQRESSAR